MKLYRYTIGGTANKTQSDAGKFREAGFHVEAYCDEQALAWAKQRVGCFMDDLTIVSKKEV